MRCLGLEEDVVSCESKEYLCKGGREVSSGYANIDGKTEVVKSGPLNVS